MDMDNKGKAPDVEPGGNGTPLLNRRQFGRSLGCAICATAGILGPMARAAAQEAEVPAKVRKLYDSSVVIDCLSTPNTFNVDYPPAGRRLTSEQLENAHRSGITAVNLTVHGDGVNDKLQAIRDIKADIAAHPDRLLLVQNAGDLMRAKKAGVTGIILGFQGLEFIQHDLSPIDRFADESVLIMQLTYNADSTIGSGCMVNLETAGLKDAGREAIRRINSRHIVVDLAHSHPQTALAAARASITPIIVSHSGCREVYPHPRNQPDEVLRAVAQGGGTFGIYTMPYLGQDPIYATRALFHRHLLHALKVCGEDHVGIGSDNSTTPLRYDDGYKDALKVMVSNRDRLGISAPLDGIGPFTIPELNSPRRLELIAWDLSKAGYSERAIEKVLGKNFQRTFADIWAS